MLVVACGSSGTAREGFDDVKPTTPNEDLGGGQPTPPLGSSGGQQSAPQDEACAAEVTKATRAEVDIIVLIDTSGSMQEEPTQVKNHINAFAQKIGSTGLGYGRSRGSRKKINEPCSSRAA